uniref:ATP-dependent DNA helicase n=1 Tax=Steinernema glaseri TaxID=37863 RepID=A0A1I8ARK7_9BILA
MSAPSSSKLSSEIAEIDEELEVIEGQIASLRHRKKTLLERKQQIGRRIENLQNVDSSELQERFEKTTFPWSEKALRVLRETFQMEAFRPLQLSAINAALSGEHSIVVMSTGAGKSLCYQLPAVMMEGIVLVVSPLVSLIEDQLYQLKKRGIHAATLNQSTDRKEATVIQNALVDPKAPLRLLYVTPEKLAKSKRVMAKLEKCAEMKRLKLVAIDEVHCCSQWGNDYRPDFKFLNILARQFKGVPIMGLTATATANVLEDVKNMLSIPAAITFRAGFNRKNLHYEVKVKPAKDADFLDELTDVLSNRFNGQSGIIYTFSRKESEEVAKALRKRGIACGPYHAHIDPTEKTRIHEQWITGKIKVIVATVAFGMGIDKPDVRFVIHHSIAKSVENFYQESGRAGRDGNPAVCLLYFRLADLYRLSTMVCTEQTGVSNLYAMLAYASQKHQCRRVRLAEHFDEEFDPSWCDASCDVCCRVGVEVSEVDVTAVYDAAKEVIAREGPKSQQGRITGNKVLELTIRQLKKTASGIDLEQALAHLILEGYLKEDFHFTEYTIISYMVLGTRTPTKAILMKTVKKSGGSEKPKAKKRKVVVESDSDVEVIPA